MSAAMMISAPNQSETWRIDGVIRGGTLTVRIKFSTVIWTAAGENLD
jgi:hypothetical protein